MPVYGWKCRVCGTVGESTSRELPPTCPNCLSPMTRDYSTVQFSPGAFKPHFNHSVGQYVTSSRDFDEKLKLAGERAGSTFSRLEPGEAPRPPDPEGIFETQARGLHDKGFTDSHGQVSIDDKGDFVPQSR